MWVMSYADVGTIRRRSSPRLVAKLILNNVGSTDDLGLYNVGSHFLV